MRSLPLFVRLQDRPVILIGQGEAAQAKRRLLERAGAQIVGADAGASLAIVAEEDEALALAAIAALKSRGVLVNAVDRPEHCDFTLPAIVDRDPVIIAIGTGGASAGLAKSLRQRLENLLPASLGTLAMALKGARGDIRARWPEGGNRRRAIDAALEPGGTLDPFAAQLEDAITRWIAGSSSNATAALHHLKITSDDPDDLTLGQARLLAQADAVFYQSGIAASIVDRARADAARHACETPPDPPPPGITLYLERA